MEKKQRNGMCRQPLDPHFRGEFESLMTPEEAGRYLRVHPKTANRYARKKTVPAIRLEGQWRFRLSDLIDWADAQVQSSRQPAE